MQPKSEPDDTDDLPAELSHAGAVVDQAIAYMARQNLSPLAIASALLGGAVGVLSQNMSEAAVIGVLENAIASVHAREIDERPPGAA